MLPLHCFNVVVQFEFEFFKFQFKLNLFESLAKERKKEKKSLFRPKTPQPAQPFSFPFFFPAAQPPSPGPVSRARRPIRAFPSCVADRRVPLVGSFSFPCAGRTPPSPSAARALPAWPARQGASASAYKRRRPHPGTLPNRRLVSARQNPSPCHGRAIGAVELGAAANSPLRRLSSKSSSRKSSDLW